MHMIGKKNTYDKMGGKSKKDKKSPEDDAGAGTGTGLERELTRPEDTETTNRPA